MKEYSNNVDLVSIIVPIFNAENYIRETIISIKKQSYQNIEVILVNDGSTDNSLKIIKETIKNDRRFRVYSMKNSGVSFSRNFGLNQAKGNYICFVDADDLISKEFVKKLYYGFTHDVDISICSLTQDFERFKSNHRSNYITYTYNEAISNTIKSNMYKGYVCNKMFKCSLIKNLKFDESIFILEDFLFTINSMLKSNKIAFIDENLYFYRKHETNTSQIFNTKKLTMIKAQNLILDKISRDLSIDILPFTSDFFKDRIALYLQYYSNLEVNKDIESTLKKSIEDIKIDKIKGLKLKLIYIISQINIKLIYFPYRINKRIKNRKGVLNYES